MAIIDGYPATSFEKKDRDWIKAVADNSAGDVLPDTTGASTGDVLAIGSDGLEWVTPPDDELPDTTGASTGDVLTIGSDGLEWDTPSGGGGTTFINGTITGYSEGYPTGITFDKTYAEISAMIANGIYPMFKVTIENFPINIFPIVYVAEDGISWSIYTSAGGAPVVVAIYTGLEDNTPYYGISIS